MTKSKRKQHPLVSVIQAADDGDTFQALEDYYRMKHWKYTHESLRITHDWLMRQFANKHGVIKNE